MTLGITPPLFTMTSRFGYLSARTARICFATYVLVLGDHHPLAICKRYGALDRISGVGRTSGGDRPAAVRGFPAREPAPRSVDEPDAAVEILERMRDIGATIVNASFRHRSPEHDVEQVEALASLARGVWFSRSRRPIRSRPR